MTKKRLAEIDIIKAFGIILMVAGHSGAPFTSFVNLFHMAVFLMASGFFFRSSTSDTVKSAAGTAVKKLRQLWWPFFLWNTVYTLLHNLFIKVNVYTDNPGIADFVTGKYVGAQSYLGLSEMAKQILKGAMFTSTTQMGGAFWFLKALFLVTVGYCFAEYLIQKILPGKCIAVQTGISVIMLLFGFGLSLMNRKLFGLEIAASCYILYHSGRVLALCQERYTAWNQKYCPFVLVGSFAVLVGLDHFSSISLGNNYYHDPLFLLVASASGWCFLYSISIYVQKVPALSNAFQLVGRHTLAIVVLHFLSMKLAAAVIVVIYHLPTYCIAAFPNLYGDRGWWPVYILVGTLLPVGLDVLYEMLVQKLQRKKQ